MALRAAASRVLPHEVAYRKKLGFPVPVRKWLADPSVNADIRRAFESEAAAEFFNVDEIGALLDVFLGQKPRVSHPDLVPAPQGPALAPRVDHLRVHPLVRAVLRHAR